MILTLMVAWTLATGVPTYCAKTYEFDWPSMAVYDSYAHAIYMNKETCRWVKKIPKGNAVDAAFGAFIYAHELAHASGIKGEIRANKVAKKTARPLSRSLGASWKKARRINQFIKYIGG